VVINRFHFKMQLLSATRQNSGEFIFHAARLPERSGHDSFHQYFTQGSIVTRFRCDGIFNDSFIANFQQIVKVKTFRKSASV